MSEWTNGYIAGVRLGFIAMRRLAQAKCGNHAEGAMEDAMTSAGLSRAQKRELDAEAHAAAEPAHQYLRRTWTGCFG